MPTLHELWAGLQARPTAGGAGNELVMQLRASASQVRLFAGLKESDGSLALIIEIPNGARPQDLTRITTKTFEAQVAPLPGLAAGKTAIAIVLRSSDFEDLFALLGEDIAGVIETAKESGDAIRAVVAKIERWRRFTERGRRRLSEEEVRGLLGELAVMCRCINHFGPLAAISAWQADGGLRDFELPQLAVEVKTYQAATGATVRISDPAQLEPAPGRPLFLAALQLSRTEVTGWTLPDAVTAAVNLMGADPEGVELLFDQLADQGYLTQHASFYTERYWIAPASLYWIDPQFPRIKSETIPPGVEAVSFSVRLAAMQSFAANADEIIGPIGPLEMGR